MALPRPPWSSSLANGSVKATATVLCAATATATGACGHLDCHRVPFVVVVVLVGTNGVLLEHDDDGDDFQDDDDDDDEEEFLDDNGVLLEYDDNDEDDVSYDDDSDDDSDGNDMVLNEKGSDMVLNGKMFTCTYSSESGAWSNPTYANHPGRLQHRLGVQCSRGQHTVPQTTYLSQNPQV